MQIIGIGIGYKKSISVDHYLKCTYCVCVCVCVRTRALVKLHMHCKIHIAVATQSIYVYISGGPLYSEPPQYVSVAT